MSPVLLQTALEASRLYPDHLVLWHSSSKLEDTAQAVNCEGHAFGFEHTARLQLDCLLPMPWNKLFSRLLIQSQGLHFNPNYTLGEDLLFCLDYMHALKTQGGQGVFALNTPLTFYEQDVSNSLTHRLRSDYFELWQTLYNRLFFDCTKVFHCPKEDLAQLHRAVLQTIAAGARDLLLRGEGSLRKRRRQVRSVLKDPWLQGHVCAMRESGLYSPYEPGLFLCSPRLIQSSFEQRETNPSRFYYLQSLGQALRCRNPFCHRRS
ncbi:glycosyl transferase, group 2 family [gut metagenome]|uniref:Glycosyl transferase, group 2 family n=1 Tax=gut metagenome TaxID=749906 RepID=J9GCK5_9ZZZZ